MIFISQKKGNHLLPNAGKRWLPFFFGLLCFVAG
jgi:hypothetical protein